MVFSSFFEKLSVRFFALSFEVCTIALPLPITLSCLVKVAIFTKNLDAENQTLINHKCVCGALNRHFCQTCVMCRNYVSCHIQLQMLCRQICPAVCRQQIYFSK